MPLGPWELAIILVIVVIIFGVGKLPQIGGALGQGIREFRTSASSPDDEDNRNSTAADRERTDVDVRSNETVTVVKDNEER